MPIFIRHRPAVAPLLGLAQNVGRFAGNRQLEQERLRQEQMQLQQQQFAHQQDRDYANDDRGWAQLDEQRRYHDALTQNRDAGLGYRYDALGQQRDLATMREGGRNDRFSEAESNKAARLKEQAMLRGDMAEAQRYHELEKQLRDQEFRQSQQGRAFEHQGNMLGQRFENQQNIFGQAEQGRMQRHEDRLAQKQKLFQEVQTAMQARQTATDERTRAAAEVSATRAMHALARQDLSDHLRQQPAKVGSVEWEDGERHRRRLQQQEAEAQIAAEESMRKIMAGTPAQPAQPAVMPSAAPTTQPVAPTTQPMAIPATQPTTQPTTQPVDPFEVYVNSLPSGARYTAPDGTIRIKP